MRQLLNQYMKSEQSFTSLGAGFATAPVGTGPFTVSEWAKDERVALVRNDAYWGASRSSPR
ncbi:hypothetical protein BJF78_25615 [Pseudonocardia sp. CNS-139]|nr:hypothetical protein BJF78_25615 [Pseudonocardia sp. CNS-139]